MAGDVGAPLKNKHIILLQRFPSFYFFLLPGVKSQHSWALLKNACISPLPVLFIHFPSFLSLFFFYFYVFKKNVTKNECYLIYPVENFNHDRYR